MKKLLSILVLVFVVSAIVIGISPVRAAGVNPINELYTDDQLVKSAESESDTADNLKSTGIGSISVWNHANQIMNGPTWDENSVRVQSLLKEKPYLRYGMVDNGVLMMQNAFLQGPTGNIPYFYAQMLLPKELLESGSTAFAADWSAAPDATSSRVFLGAMGMNKLWGISFTLAMSILVVILIIAGFMIMFRSKAGGQVVVTVSLALQNAVIGAVLALASYAMGAFFLNLSKYLVLVIGALFDTVYAGKLSVIYINGPWKLFTDFSYTLITGTFAPDFNNWFNMVSKGVLSNISGNETGLAKFGDILLSGLKGGANLIGYSLVFVITKVIFAGAILVTSIRIFWAVLSTYIKMIIDIILAPILFMVSSLPGKQSGFSTWIKRMFQNAISIPIMFTFVNVAAYMAYSVAVAGAGCTGDDKSILTCVTGGLIPAGSTNGTDWLITAVGPSIIVALVVLNMVPSVPVMVNEMFSAKGGDFSKAWEGAKKSLQSMPAIGGLFQ